MHISMIAARCNKACLEEIARIIKSQENVCILSGPEGAMVMMKHRDPLEKTPFFPGEIYVTSCTLKVGNALGYGCVMDNDGERAIVSAMIDAVISAGLPVELMIRPVLEKARCDLEKDDIDEWYCTMSTKVDFVTQPE